MKMHVRRILGQRRGSWSAYDNNNQTSIRGNWEQATETEPAVFSTNPQPEKEGESSPETTELEAWYDRHLGFFQTWCYCPTVWCGIRWEEREGEKDWFGMSSGMTEVYMSADVPCELAFSDEMTFNAGWGIGKNLENAQLDLEVGLHWLCEHWLQYTGTPTPNPYEILDDAPDEVNLAAYAKLVEDDLIDQMRAVQSAFEAYEDVRAEALRLRELGLDMRKRRSLGNGAWSMLELATEVAIDDVIHVEGPEWLDE